MSSNQGSDSGAVEDVKGSVKETAGSVLGQPDMVAEGQAQQEKADAEKDAARKEAEAGAARDAAEQKEREQQRYS